MDSNHVSVERFISATPTEIFSLLSDAAKHKTFDGSGTVKGTQSPSLPLQLGTKFGMSMKMGAPYKTSNTVVEYEQDSTIAWQTSGFGGLFGGRIWRYELTPEADGTRVVETWDISKDKQGFLLKRTKFPAMTRDNMTRTLDRLATQVETE